MTKSARAAKRKKKAAKLLQKQQKTNKEAKAARAYQQFLRGVAPHRELKAARFEKRIWGVVCKYNTGGSCARSSACKFAHPPLEEMNREACVYDARGHCGRGDQCIYMHSSDSSGGGGGMGYGGDYDDGFDYGGADNTGFDAFDGGVDAAGVFYDSSLPLPSSSSSSVRQPELGKCFVCNANDHVALDCPPSDFGGKCFNCHSTDHQYNNCPTPISLATLSNSSSSSSSLPSPSSSSSSSLPSSSSSSSSSFAVKSEPPPLESGITHAYPLPLPVETDVHVHPLVAESRRLYPPPPPNSAAAFISAAVDDAIASTSLSALASLSSSSSLSTYASNGNNVDTIDGAAAVAAARALGERNGNNDAMRAIHPAANAAARAAANTAAAARVLENDERERLWSTYQKEAYADAYVKARSAHVARSNAIRSMRSFQQAPPTAGYIPLGGGNNSFNNNSNNNNINNTTSSINARFKNAQLTTLLPPRSTASPSVALAPGVYTRASAPNHAVVDEAVYGQVGMGCSKSPCESD
jgi:hypothetical protein